MKKAKGSAGKSSEEARKSEEERRGCPIEAEALVGVRGKSDHGLVR
jgi:hypothetical protein